MNNIRKAIEWLCSIKLNDSQKVWQAVLIIEELLIKLIKSDKKE